MNDQILQAIDQFKRTFPDARFILFGSYATNKASTDSDLDLCAVFPSLYKDPFNLIYDIRSDTNTYS